MSIQSMNDQELVCLYIGGNHQALETLIRRHQSRIFSAILMVMRDRATAEDVFQDTFIRVIQTLKKGEYNEEGKFLPWVLRISRNLVIDHYRRVKKMPPAPVFINEEGKKSACSTPCLQKMTMCVLNKRALNEKCDNSLINCPTTNAK